MVASANTRKKYKNYIARKTKPKKSASKKKCLDEHSR